MRKNQKMDFWIFVLVYIFEKIEKKERKGKWEMEMVCDVFTAWIGDEDMEISSRFLDGRLGLG